MRTLKDLKDILAAYKEEIRKKYGVIILGIFGSYAREEQNEFSDIDILVDLEKPIGLKFFELWDELENLLGIKVDLLTIKSVKQKPLLWKSIKGSVVYV
ncbi:MAG: nucleotidyltransferase family protein [Candidatus Helarchaeota archaeon]